MNIIDIVFAAMVPIAFAVAIWYYVSLFKLSRILARDNPQVLSRAREKRLMRTSNLRAAYLVLSGTKDSAFDGCKLSSRALEARTQASRLLYISVCVFMVLLAAGLTVSVTKA
ncbi:hypothetical protein [Rhodanobacter sp. DHB23]|uniref:hypothetical protein n=1 Tax=Rhodanobacter sp. DHB23 TaxID=2775923 RepID=UPI0017865BCA|nr:hypothetical protein [Rhodanobacter sp. DHB23]MBD8871831.1 hypothetical protein [Rhodanobacter sp. DHB23]